MHEKKKRLLTEVDSKRIFHPLLTTYHPSHTREKINESAIASFTVMRHNSQGNY